MALKPGTTEPEPGLAESWEPNDDGTVWTFKIREGVEFHDGEPLNAEAVCFNFDRWYNFKGALANPAASYYWQVVFGGFADLRPGQRRSRGEPLRELRGDRRVDRGDHADEAVGDVHPGALSAVVLDCQPEGPAGRATPTRARSTRKASSPRPARSAPSIPIGTGPFKFDSWVRNDRLTLVKNEDYWGDQAKLDELIIRPIADNAARLQALQSGEIQGYDLVEPQDIATIEGDSNLQIIDRPAFNVAYVGFNIARKPTDDIEVRKAIAYGLDRQAVVDNFYSGRGVVATQFMPPEVLGYADDVTTYEYDPEKAKQTLHGRRLHAAGRDRVLVSDGRVPSVHAGPEAELRGVRREPEQVGLQGDAEECPVEPGLPRTRGCRHRRQRSVCSAGRATTAMPTTSSARSSSLRKGLGHDDDAADGDPEPAQRGRDRDRRAKRQEPSTRTPTGRSWSSFRVSRMRTRSRRSRSTPTSRATIASPTTNESFAPVTARRIGEG